MSENSSSGWSLWSILLVVFITLKLAQIGLVADWSWWWVLSPIWIPVILGVLIFFIIPSFILLIYKIFK